MVLGPVGSVISRAGRGMKWLGGHVEGGIRKIGGAIMDDPGAEDERKRKDLLYDQGKRAGIFADRAQVGYGKLGNEAEAQRDHLRRLAGGEESISKEQLRQALQQLQSQQISMAQGGPPGQAAANARTAAMNAMRIGQGAAGQQVLAGLQERQAANQALANMILQQRGQDLSALLGSRQNALGAYGAGNAGAPEKSWIEKYGPTAAGIATFAASDERLKTDVRDGDEVANKMIDGLRSFLYKYKDKRDGDGDHLSGMAQDYERVGLKSVVVDTPRGKMVHGAKLAGANTAMIAALGRRVRELEAERGR